MNTFIIGDVHGCCQQLEALLKKIHYTSGDTLIFVGDLVNRGPQSLETLRLVKRLNAQVTLGNHDFYCLALGYGVVDYGEDHSLQVIMQAPDRLELLDWLRMQPLMIKNDAQKFVVSHAGISPAWSLDAALHYALEFTQALQQTELKTFFSHVWGNEPSHWSEELTGYERLRYILNAFTRMRFTQDDGTLDLVHNGSADHAPAGFKPWFDCRGNDDGYQLYYGHWAALEGKADKANVHALDTGCVYGGALTAVCVESGERFSVSAKA